MKRRNVTALAYGLIALLIAVTAVFIKVMPDAESEKQKTVEASAVGNTGDDTNLTVTESAGVAAYIGNLGSTTVSVSFVKEMLSQATKTMESISNVSSAEIEQKMTETSQQKQQEKAAQWEGRAIASNVEDYVYVRSEATTESDAVGMLTKGAAGDVVEKGEEWTLISSGEVEGYVSNDYLAFDEEALSVAEEVCDYVAVADADMISVRQSPDSEAEILEIANEGDTFEVVEEGSEWVKVATSESVGFMSKSVVQVKWDVAVATPIEHESDANQLTEDTDSSQSAADTDSAQSTTGSSQSTDSSTTGESQSTGSSSSSGSGKSTESSADNSQSTDNSSGSSQSNGSETSTASSQTSVQEVSSGSSTSNSATFRVTAYCSCDICCGSHSNGKTAAGTTATAGRTIAVDTSIIPLGTTVYINGVAYVAEDTGVSGNVIDIYMSSHSAALQWGVQYCTVTW